MLVTLATEVRIHTRTRNPNDHGHLPAGTSRPRDFDSTGLAAKQGYVRLLARRPQMHKTPEPLVTPGLPEEIKELSLAKYS
jgi:hypothetical protein